MTETILTKRQQQIASKHAAIRCEFDRLRGEHPGASTWRICVVISERYHLTPQQIRNIIG